MGADALRRMRNDERGQMAFAMVLSLLFVVTMFALAFDVGVWYFDHRSAETQAEAAALAAAQSLPSVATAVAVAETRLWLQRNAVACNEADDCPSVDGTCPDEPSECVTISFSGGNSTVQVDVRRESPGLFAGVGGVTSVRVSASATSRVGPADSAVVLTQPTMPFAIAAQDPDCNSSGESCSGTSSMCVGATFEACPWGLDPDALYVFDETQAGIAGIVEACGTGVTNHLDCVDGAGIDENGFASGSPITVPTADPALVMPGTVAALEARAGFAESPIGNCDEPTASAARARYRADVACRHRVVLIPVVRLPGGTDFGDPLSGSPELLGVATFGIAGWERSGASEELWGYLMGPDAAEVHPPGFRLQRIAPSTEVNPLAPKLIALVN